MSCNKNEPTVFLYVLHMSNTRKNSVRALRKLLIVTLLYKYIKMKAFSHKMNLLSRLEQKILGLSTSSFAYRGASRVICYKKW